MPSIDSRAKAFQMKLAARFGAAVSTRRKALKLTASEVSRRTAELGYPISRGAIAQIESNSRSGKVDVAELLILAAALDIPPVLLLFSGYPWATVETVLPGVEVAVEDAVRWLSGHISYPPKKTRTRGPAEIEDFRPPNDGVKLIAATSAVEKALEERASLINEVDKAEDRDEVEIAERTLNINTEKVSGMLHELVDLQAAVWGGGPPTSHPDVPEPQSDG